MFEESRSDRYTFGTAWIGLEQNLIDTAVNEWRKRLLACIRIVGKHFKQFYCRQLKMDNLMKCQPKCQKCKQNVFSRVMLIYVMLIKQSYRIG